MADKDSKKLALMAPEERPASGDLSASQKDKSATLTLAEGSEAPKQDASKEGRTSWRDARQIAIAAKGLRDDEYLSDKEEEDTIDDTTAAPGAVPVQGIGTSSGADADVERQEQAIAIEEDETPIEARMVKEPPMAEIVEPETNKNRKFWAIGSFFLVVVAVVLVAVLTGNNRNDPLEPKKTPSPTIMSDEDYLYQLLLPISGEEALNNSNSSAFQAFHWMIEDDPAELDFRTTEPGILLDRFVVATFYFATGGPTSWVGQFDFLSNTSVCEWPPLETEDRENARRVDCNENGRVAKLVMCE